MLYFIAVNIFIKKMYDLQQTMRNDKYNLESEENRYYKDSSPPPNILKAQVEEDYLRAGVGRSFFRELPESINTISTEI